MSFRAGLLACALTLFVGCAATVDEEPESSGQAAVEAITLENWEDHPKIVAVTVISDAVKRAHSRGQLGETRKAGSCSGAGEGTRVLGVDSESVRLLESESSDGSWTRSLYFDPKGRLRLLLVQRTDASGPASEQRAYFDDRGTRIWEVSRRRGSVGADAVPVTRAPFEVVAEASGLALYPSELDAPKNAFEAAPRCDIRP